MPGGVTNRNFRVDADDQTVVVRLGTEGAEVLGINRPRERQAMAVAARIGVAPEVLYARPAAGILVTRYVRGRTLPADRAVTPGTRRRLVRALRLLHHGPAFGRRFSPARVLSAYRRAARDASAPLPPDIDALYASAGRLSRMLRAAARPLRPCHNDLWGPNLIDDGRRLWIVDWEYAAMGDPYFDLANFAVYHCPSAAATRGFVRAYFGRVRRGDLARVRLMSPIVLLREAMWYVVARRLPTAGAGFDRAAARFFARARRALADRRLPGWIGDLDAP